MRSWLGQNKSKDEPGNRSESITIRVIGDRSSGKTTYMAALARWPNTDLSSPVQAVSAFNEDGEALVEQAQNILEQGLRLEPTRLESNINLPDYGLQIVLKEGLSWQNPTLDVGSQILTLTINCKDYSGEFFTDLLYRTGDSLLEEYLNDCSEADGILFLIDGIARRKDAEYARGVDKFLGLWRQLDTKQHRIALVLTKCEQPDLWIKRNQPKALTQARFPQTHQRLESWQRSGNGRVEYFTASAFGILGTRFPEANSQKIRRDRDGVTSVLKKPELWRPFGLVSPIYWLYAGKRHQALEQV